MGCTGSWLAQMCRAALSLWRNGYRHCLIGLEYEARAASCRVHPLSSIQLPMPFCHANVQLSRLQTLIFLLNKWQTSFTELICPYFFSDLNICLHRVYLNIVQGELETGRGESNWKKYGANRSLFSHVRTADFLESELGVHSVTVDANGRCLRPIMRKIVDFATTPRLNWTKSLIFQ